MTSDITPGLLVLHGNRLELLKEAVFDWIGRAPLEPLEEEVFLVQSNGVAEWLKRALAEARGICAATRVELPGRFLWRSYREVLGRNAVPSRAPLDKSALAWRLMRLLPQCMDKPGFEPLARFLTPGDVGRRLQLAQRLADLFDQYQVYRSDWLDAWAEGRDVLPRFGNIELSAASVPSAASTGDPFREPPLAEDQRWQSALWREVLRESTEAERTAARPQLHRRYLEAMEALDADDRHALPVARRVVLFGMSHVPMQTLQALAATARISQVLLAVPNPCQYHWADIIEGRELLQAQRRRHPHRAADLAAVSLEDLHAHAHPLLAAWGRQGRDFVRQLDAFDDARAAQQRFAVPRIDLFDEGEGGTLLQQMQARIRDLVPLAEHPPSELAGGDRSVVFHVAHSAQREVEILHDQLLALLDDDGRHGKKLAPRDIVVMVPEIDSFAPAIRAVFGQHSKASLDRRFIPFDIADLTHRGNNPLAVALEWLLRLPQQRCRLAEVRDLLDVPAVAAHFGIDEAGAARLSQWTAGAGVRWGLHEAQRAGLGLDACGEQNTWLFGLRRMLLGYASGEDAAFAGIEPYGEVGGLEAALAGSLAHVVQALNEWWQLASTDATPAEWAARGRELLLSFFSPTDERERLTVSSLQDTLRRWLEDCESAGFDEPVPVSVLREAWLGGLDEPTLGKRFLAGGVTFCTLMPMRAVPFEVVCLLGMNDGDYPRSTSRADFDLMGLPGQRRPGDRSRRDDDRYLMLEALLSARHTLYVSWTGRSARDNSEQPPSVLVSQLRDYLDAGWGRGTAAVRTTEHPLQPFSRRYFEAPEDAGAGEGAGNALFTFAREWRSAHAADETSATASPRSVLAATAPDAETPPLTVQTLARFLAEPVRQFFSDQLQVRFEEVEVPPDDEAFSMAGLDHYQLLGELIGDTGFEPMASAEEASHRSGDALNEHLNRHLNESALRIQRTGRLPMARPGNMAREELVQTALPMLRAWRAQLAALERPAEKEPLRFEYEGIVLDDWLDGLRADVPGAETRLVHMQITPRRLLENVNRKSPPPQADKLVEPWVRLLVASACGKRARAVVVARDAVLHLEPLPQAEAVPLLQSLMQAWRDGMLQPLPLARRTALALVKKGQADPAEVYEGGFGGHGEVNEPCLARIFPDYETLNEDEHFSALAEQLYGPMHDWVKQHVRATPLDADEAAAQPETVDE